MRLLHTGDWHVGKTLRGRGRAEEHRAVLDEIVGIAREFAVDVALVAGDLFETSAPTAEAEDIVYSALLGLADTGARVVVVAGNHDHPGRLDAVAPVLERAGVYVAARVAPPERGGVLSVETAHGERLALALLPFLSQRGIVRAADLMEKDAHEHAQTYAERVQRIVAALCAGLPGDGVRVLVAHAMVAGGLLGGGERSAHTVFDYAVPATAFPASLHYVALGHLHRAQEIPGACPIRYAGSPLQLDFGEAQDDKVVLLVEAHADRPARVDAVPLRSGRRLRTLRLRLSELDAAAARHAGEFLRIDLDEFPAPGLAERVREKLPNALDVRVLRRAAAATSSPRGKRPGTQRPRDLFSAYLAERGIEDSRLLALFDELVEEIHAADQA